MSLSDQVLKHVQTTYVTPARQRGETTIRVIAGDVHRDLRWTNRVPSVCTTLASQKFQKTIGVELITREGPPSGFGTRSTFTYRLPSEDRSSDTGGKKRGNLLALFGIAADVFRDLGGGENFIRKQRENFDFRYDVNAQNPKKRSK